jgi:hypothetical protein
MGCQYEGTVELAELIDQLEWIIPLVGALVILLLATYILNRYRKNRMQASLFWGLALIAQSANFLIEFALHSSVVPRNASSVFVAQLFSASMLVLFYVGFAVSLSKGTFYTKILPLFLLGAQVSILAYVDFALDRYIFATVLQMGFFGFPLLIFFGAFFFWDYVYHKRKPSLVLGTGWWIIAAALPLYAVTIASPYETLYHTLVLFAAILMFLGFIVLARKSGGTGQKQRFD